MSTSENDNSFPRKFLKEIGVILSLSGFVSIFCTLFGSSARVTAVVTLVVAALVLLALYRDLVNKVGSPLLLALLLTLSIGFSTITYFTASPTILGLEYQYVQSSDIHGDIAAYLDESTGELLMFGTSFHITIDERRLQILNALRRGVSVKVLTFDPQSKNLPILASTLENSVKELTGECEATVSQLRKLSIAWNAEKLQHAMPGTLEIRLHSTIPHARVYCFGSGPKARTLIVPYANSSRSVDSPAWLFSSDSRVATQYRSGVNQVWADSPLFP